MNTTIPLLVYVIKAVVTLLVGAVAAIFMGIAYRRKVAEAEMGSAEDEAKRILSDAIKTAESKKRNHQVRRRTKFTKCAKWNVNRKLDRIMSNSRHGNRYKNALQNHSTTSIWCQIPQAAVYADIIVPVDVIKPCKLKLF